MGKTVISHDKRFEWDEEKNLTNKKKHGFSFEEILEIFDDPAFLEGYDDEHSETEERYYGIGCIDNILYVIAFYSIKEMSAKIERKRIISARQADKEEKEKYNDYFKKIKF